jgi:microcystin degradation protein MlrC
VTGSLRVAVGGLSHETNTFTPVATTVGDFTWWNARGEDLVGLFAGTNSPIGGFLDGAAEHRLEVVPTLHVEALPSGPLGRAEFDELLGRLLAAIEEVLPVDGVLLDLHGAMAARGVDDCDGEILRRVRELVGGGVRVVAQLDIHANLSELMAEQADLLVGRRTYPEIDMAERGRDCAALIARLCREELDPRVAMRRPPLIWGTAQATAHGEMAELIGRLDAVLAEPDVLTACVLTGFGWADSPSTGSSIYVATVADKRGAERFADELLAFVLEHRENWYEQLPDTRAAVRAAAAIGQYPVVLADYLDNPGNGSPGDSTGMLRAFLEEGVEDACLLYMVDPASVRRCREAGVGATLRLSIGGRSHPAQGSPVEADATVEALSDGRFIYTNLYAGLESSMGPSALVRVGGVDVVLVSEREQPFGPEFAESLGLEPSRLRWIGVKSMQHFRAGFEPIAGHVQLVEEPNVNGPRPPYRRLGRPLYPIDPSA